MQFRSLNLEFGGICKGEMTLVVVYAVVFDMYFVIFTCSCSLLKKSVESLRRSCLDLTNPVFHASPNLVSCSFLLQIVILLTFWARIYSGLSFYFRI